MKKYFVALLLFIYMHGFSQVTNSILIKHDTTLLKAEECEWIIKSLTKNNPTLTSEIGKSIPFVILQAIAKGKLKAIDPLTNKPIAGKQIYTWGIRVDTMQVYDDAGNFTYKAIQPERSSTAISFIRIYQDWFFDVALGKFKTEIKWIELMEDIYLPTTGIFLGHKALCRIFY
jgi:hypothetical protein